MSNSTAAGLLQGKTAIVTGASRGIGAGIALELAKRGANVVITYTSEGSEKEVDALISKIEGLGNGAKGVGIRADLKDPASAGSIAAKAADFAPAGTQAGKHQINILVNNAGVELNKRLGEISVEDFEDVYQVNVRAVLLLTQACLPFFPPHSRIINVSSVGGRSGIPGYSVYCSSKAAVEGLTRCFAAELGQNGTTVNCINPGGVDTDMLKKIPTDIVEGQKQVTPIQNRIASVEEIGRLVAGLSGDDFSWVTGAVISASGGYAMY